MARATSWVVTANRLSDGEILYRTDQGTWSTRFEDAAATDSRRADAWVAEARERPQELVDIYRFEVRVEGERLVPLSARERVRAEGPSVPKAVLARHPRPGAH